MSDNGSDDGRMPYVFSEGAGPGSVAEADQVHQDAVVTLRKSKRFLLLTDQSDGDDTKIELHGSTGIGTRQEHALFFLACLATIWGEIPKIVPGASHTDIIQGALQCLAASETKP